MPLTPEDVQNKEFTTVRLREGYDMQEVDEFLDEVEAELSRMHRENEELRDKLAAVTRGGGSASAAGPLGAREQPLAVGGQVLGVRGCLRVADQWLIGSAVSAYLHR